MPNIQDPNFNKNVSMVYVEEPGFSGYKGFDFSKIDDVESILRSGIVSGTNALLTGVLVNTNDIELYASGIKQDSNSINNKLFITGDPYPAGVQGTIVYQADLSAQFDNVDIAGYAGADLSGINQTMSNTWPIYDSVELKYDGSSNNTGVFYKLDGSLKRVIEMKYDASNNITGINKIIF